MCKDSRGQVSNLFLSDTGLARPGSALGQRPSRQASSKPRQQGPGEVGMGGVPWAQKGSKCVATRVEVSPIPGVQLS